MLVDSGVPSGVRHELSNPSLAHLLGRLRVIENRVRLVVDARRSVDPDPNDRFRGLYISDAHVDLLIARSNGQPAAAPIDDETADLLAAVERAAGTAEREGAQIRLRSVARSFGLDEVDVELLLVAMAPDLDPRFEKLYAYLQDDVSRRRPTVGLALEVCGSPPATGRDRGRLSAHGILISAGLLVVDDVDRPFLSRSLRVPDRVTAFLLGDDSMEPHLVTALGTPVALAGETADRLQRALASGVAFVYVEERLGAFAPSLAIEALHRLEVPIVCVDLSRTMASDPLVDIVASAVREARLREGAVVIAPIEVLVDRAPAGIRLLADGKARAVLAGSRGWDPSWSANVPLTVDADLPSLDLRSDIWRSVVGAVDGQASIEIADLVHYRLSPEQVHRAATAARLHASADGTAVESEHLRAGARAQNAAGLERLARRVQPTVSWADLVLPEEVIVQLREIASRARYRDVVLDEWGMGRKSSKGRGLTALFAGDSGTGKTMSAEVLARDLGLDLYVIDLSTVIDKYVGETEKNLDRIFAEADRVNGVLLFDEADAVFGKRSDVKDSHDRYANVEVAYLLQRMELFDGLAILTTNLRSNLDEAFTRRLDAVVDFPIPEEDDRRVLWSKNLIDGLPRADDIDLDFLARSFKLSGGNIRNIALAAAYLAAGEQRSVRMADLIHGTVREYQKLGRLTVESEFGKYLNTPGGEE